MLERRTKIRRLSIWFGLNLIVFIVCYLNYRLQLKHRYLFKTLNIGLCLSRAAAMVINFNLILVWMPMCKYSLTRVAYYANGTLRHQKLYQQGLRSSLETRHQADNRSDHSIRILLRKLKLSMRVAIAQVRLWFCLAKINTTNSFLIAVDHCKSVHTICATTITIASVVHTVAHLMNVINFSKNYDPILSDLNMAEYKGQNPLELLVSVPGITGILMLLILILMSLSSLDFIRTLSFDLFQIFHRLSIVFVILLVLHPASHVLKEQSNVSRHHPELCYNNSIMMEARLATILNATHAGTTVLAAKPAPQGEPNRAHDSAQPVWSAAARNDSELQALRHSERILANFTAHHFNSYRAVNKQTERRIADDLKKSKPNATSNSNQHNKLFSSSSSRRSSGSGSSNGSSNSSRSSIDGGSHVRRGEFENPNSNHHELKPGRGEPVQLANLTSSAATADQQPCLDPMPLFVAQNSICWYALSAGLSCYLLDLILRKRRRSKGTIQLLDVRADCEGNLIELIFNNNHKRFSHWLPGQFVYLNCPQVANFEWHPFTISSMDNANRLFTLHIKTGGDWTRKLRVKLGLTPASDNDSMSDLSTPTFRAIGQETKSDCNITISGEFLRRHETPILPDLVCYNRSGKPLVQCTKLVRINHDNDRSDCNESVSDSEGSLYSISADLCRNSSNNGPSVGGGPLDLYIDGPFHSPFERLLEQPVSIGIANGVGWTAFSSAFQCVTNNLAIESNKFSKDWWIRQHKLCLSQKEPIDPNYGLDDQPKKLSKTKLHLMVIVTSIEQLKPFYKLALNYFDRINESSIREDDPANPVKEITTFITRSDKDDKSVTDFCIRENLSFPKDDHIIRVNKTFTIRFGKPNFEMFLGSLRAIYADERKISVYCCGSNQVKKIVRELCHDLNKTNQRNRGCQVNPPYYSYHEESF